MANKMRIYDDVKDMVEEEIEKIVKQGELNHDSLMNLDTLIDISKDICEVKMSSDDSETGYSQRMYPPMYAYAYDNGNSYRNGNMNSNMNSNMGRYSRNNYDEGMSNNGYSRHGGDMADRLGRMMSEASTERERDAIRRALEAI